MIEELIPSEPEIEGEDESPEVEPKESGEGEGEQDCGAGRRRPVTPEAFDAKFRKVAREAIDGMDAKSLLKNASAYKVMRELIVIADKSRLARLEKKAAAKREARRKKALESGNELDALRLSAPVASEAWDKG